MQDLILVDSTEESFEGVALGRNFTVSHRNGGQ